MGCKQRGVLVILHHILVGIFIVFSIDAEHFPWLSGKPNLSSTSSWCLLNILT